MFIRSLKLTFSNLWRNKFLTSATIIVIGLILFIFNIILTINFLAHSSLQDLGQKVDIIVYLQDNADFLRVNQLMTYLAELPEIQEVNYTSKEAALQSFLEKYPEKSDPFTKYGIPNPLPSNLQIITKTPEDHEKILNLLNQSEYQDLLLEVESNLENQKIVQKLIQIGNSTKHLIWGVILAFMIGSLLIIMNAIHLTIYTRKKEIQIMHLVGADLGFIRLPFLLEGAFYGLCAAFLGFFLLLIFLQGLELKEINLGAYQINLLLIFLLQLLISGAIGIASSQLAINHYLKQKLTSD